MSRRILQPEEEEFRFRGGAIAGAVVAIFCFGGVVGWGVLAYFFFDWLIG